MKKIAIIGAGISGLYIANLFKDNKDYQVTIYEKKSSIELSEGYGIQLSVNSVKLLNKIGFNSLTEEDRFNPKKIDFYEIKNSKKICDLEISKFNSDNCKYTTLKRSKLLQFLKKQLNDDTIKYNSSIDKIEYDKDSIRLIFKNSQTNCDYLIISDGVFSKSKNLISNNEIKPRYNNTLAIRGTLSKSPDKIDNKNISLFLGPDFHHVIYPVNYKGDLNFIAILKYQLSDKEQENYSLFNDNSFIEKILKKIPLESKELFEDLKELKMFPVFISDNFYESQNNNIHLIGDAFFAYPPSFAQGASQSIEGAYELFKSIENNTENNFFKNRVKKTKMVNLRSKINQFAFHLSNPLIIFFRNVVLKKLVKNKKFLETYLGRIYKN